jgi:hypothetical protein
MSEGSIKTSSLTKFSWRKCLSYPAGMQKSSIESETIQKFSKEVETSSFEVIKS